MAKFLWKASYTSEGVKGVLKEGGDGTEGRRRKGCRGAWRRGRELLLRARRGRRLRDRRAA